ncbi:hypothetical protein BU24DRAFT_444151 [Aaosphaeria arxii CBS 175.79]|uniref:Malate dehydrogenase n=1 Tax=Aaosphaeria arxii CBS 175.79 TaxID=1450172 RepID=A0A6A5XDS1_9PLEO|nr:uncharacterized protein BU24DRAFT_444151 [Aaosphaeria arxii CBS 175.79]KAF2010966.1 hypothetical protein BU24DRAFT_444151 [Aaosphaeria arxii CBS 175.79]
MLFTNTLAFILAVAPTALFAAPTPTKRDLSAATVKLLQNGTCDLSELKMPIAPTPLPEPFGLKLAHIAVGRGTQNYTCATASSTDAPKAVGAVASLYNATCSAVRAPAVLADITKLALDHAIPKNDIAQKLLSGHHEFTAAGVPLFLLQSDNNNYGYVQAKKNSSSDAPTTATKGTNNLGSVPWLKLDAVEGDYKAVYRINTAGGVAPKTCEGITGAFTVEYAAEYWFYN